MAANQTTNNNSIRSIPDKEKLNGSNFLDWFRNLRIVLGNEQKLHHLEEALPEAPPALLLFATPTPVGSLNNKKYLVLCWLSKNCLKQAEQELFEGQSIITYVLKMKAYLDQMERFGYPMPLVLGVNLILTSISKDYDQFVQNYNMHGDSSEYIYI
nr:hypothetical protein [Tanacetum cinerariifolium]